MHLRLSIIVGYNFPATLISTDSAHFWHSWRRVFKKSRDWLC